MSGTPVTRLSGQSVHLSASKLNTCVRPRPARGVAHGTGRGASTCAAYTKEGGNGEVPEEVRKAVEAKVGFTIEKLRADGYKLKKLERLCKQNGLRPKGTADKLKSRLEHFYETQPGIVSLPLCFKFDNWLVYKAQSREITNALADCSTTLDDLAGLFTEEECSEIVTFAKEELHMTFDDEAAAIDRVLDLLQEQSESNGVTGESYEWDEPSTSNPSELTEDHSP